MLEESIETAINKAEQSKDIDRNTLEELLESNGYISVKELTERFVDVDDYYNHEPWTLNQILANINLIIPRK